MIYVLISDSNVHHNKTEQIEKRDCRLVRQPLSLLPDNIKEYIENTKNEELRAERYLAYTSLLCGLKAFFDVENPEIKKSDKGKPYLVINGVENIGSNICNLTENIEDQKNKDFDYLLVSNSDEKKAPEVTNYISDNLFSIPCSADCDKKGNKIFISISHSEGVAAVCLSDEGEVGIDIQAVIDSRRTGKLNERFFSALSAVNSEANVKYYLCSINESKSVMKEFKLIDADAKDETCRWAYCESLLKLSGSGFGDLKNISDIANRTKTELKKYVSDNDDFVIAVSIFE